MNPLVDCSHHTRRLTLLGLFLLCSCAGTETGNPSLTRQASLSMVLKSNDTSAAQICPANGACTGAGLNIQSAWLATDYLEALSCVGQDDSGLPPTAWDLLHPLARNFDTQIADFCGFHFVTRLADSGLGNVPAELIGASIWLRATRADNVVVDVQSPAIIDVAKVDPSQPLSNAKLIVALDAAAWLNGIDVNSLIAGSDGVARVSSTSNALVLQQVDQQTGDNAILRNEEADDGVTDN